MKYIKNEWIKLWSQKSAWIMLALSCLLVVGAAGILKYYEDPQSTAEQRKEANQEDIKFYQSLLADENLEEEEHAYYEEYIQLTEYRIAQDLPVEHATSFDDFMLTMLQVTILLVSIYMIVIAASIVSAEFSTGTIKMLLTRPVSRWKILLSKLATVFLYGLTVFTITIALAAIVAAILWGTDLGVTLSIVDGNIVESSSMSEFGNTLLYAIVGLIVNTLFAFMLGTVFNSSTLAVGISLLITMMGGTILMFISKYAFAKYLWFANDLGQYAPGNSPSLEGLTFGFSLTINIIYIIIFLGITLLHFTKRDVTA